MTSLAPFRHAFKHPMLLLLGLLVVLGCLPGALFAQAPEGAIVLPSDVSVRGTGWGQIHDFVELGDFFLSVVETLVFVAAFAFHPKANALREGARGWVVQASLFLFGLIGMLIGFLVLHHGYLIGFVVFGIGGLFRFRMETSSLLDGALLIMVTLIGLAVGLDLPVMALVATLAGFVTLWFVTSAKTSALELKFADDATLRAALEVLRGAVERKGFRVVSVRKTEFKPVVEMVVSHQTAEALNDIPQILDELDRAGHGVKDWYVA
ncbi:hypothetical protein [Roseovarius aestuariivivens]|uniref:hypothetical protein n=1 Tax=Roseovarius aestuariivivens TaxID=1888910 RepID=UPI0010806230|nr:hypothetical protein [Roseovarius aestuariivivens]